MRAVVRRERYGARVFKVAGKLKDVPDCCPSEPIERLVLISDNTDVPGISRKPEEKLLLDIVGVLVLVHQYISNAAGNSGSYLRIFEKFKEEFLLVGKVYAVFLKQLGLVCLISPANDTDE